MNKIDWKQPPPYNHAGTWNKQYQSIMSPTEKITWPQLLCEYVIFWRSRIFKDFPQLKKGPGWSAQIQSKVRSLNQQMPVICNYFEHPQKEPLVVYAFKKFFKEHRIVDVGGFKKNRISKTATGKETDNISQSEKDVVTGITIELDKIKAMRNIINEVKPSLTPNEPITFRANSGQKNKLNRALETEKELNNGG